MKAAICISGQPRDIDVGVEQVLKNIVKHNININFDIFCHAWTPESDNLWDTAQDHQRLEVGVQKKKACETILSVLQPKLWLFEKQVDFSNYTKFFNSHPTAKQASLASNFYSVYAANNLKRQYEIMHNFVYDCVIRMRYDLFFNKPVDVSLYKGLFEDKIVVPANYQRDQDRIHWNIRNKGMVDVFGLSSSENMDKYSQTFLHMPSVNQEYFPPFGEVYLGVNARIINELELSYADIDLDLIRRTPYASK